MQLGSNPASSSSAAGGRSVGQRIKDATLKDSSVAATAGSNVPSSAVFATSSMIHNNNTGNNCSVVTSRQSRTTLCSGEHAQQFKQVVLSETQKNTVRIIGQYLRDLGMNDTVDSLVEESGCRIESCESIRLREYVVQGAWNKALDIIELFKIKITERQYLTCRVLLLEEKFRDYLDCGELLLALRLLQAEYPKNREFKSRYEHLASVLMSNPPSSLASQYADGAERKEVAKKKNEGVLEVLYKVLPPHLMLPPSRLQQLLRQSWIHQMKRCDLHVSSSDDIMDEKAILKDHQCSGEFPTRNTQILHDHCAEVWCLEFSPCGQYLASGAKSNCVLIWEVETAQKLRVYRRLQIPQDVSGISSISWSQDSKYLTIASTEENATGVFIMNVAKGVLTKEYRHFPADSFSVVCFFKDHSHRFACGDQRGHFHAYDIDRTEDVPKCFDGFRIRCIYSMKDGKSVLAADTHNRIRLYDFKSAMQEATIIQETSQIMFFTVDHDERHCLVTTKTEGIRLWCLKSKTLIKSFFGSVHSEFVISSSFGGAHDNFIASGSEDDNVVIWNINNSQPIRSLTGHKGTVNAVSWNPVHVGMLASGSDDGTIRIWATK